MHTAAGRCNAVFFFSLAVCCFATFMSAVSVMYRHPDVPAVVTKHRVSSFRSFYHPIYDSRITEAQLAFDMEADFSDIFDWNAKQIFVYLTAEYKNEDNVENRVVLWDKIIQHNETHKFNFQAEKVEYALRETASLKNQDIELVVRWDTMPFIGWIKPGGGEARHRYKMTLPKQFR